MDTGTLQKSLENAKNSVVKSNADKNSADDETTAKPTNSDNTDDSNTDTNNSDEGRRPAKQPRGDDDDSGGGSGDKAEKDEKKEKVEFKVIYNKKKYDVSFELDSDVAALKSHLQPIIDIPPAMMKVMIKGLAKDEMTLRKLGVNKGSKVMVVGSSLNDVLSVSTTPTPQQLKADEDKAKSSSAESSSSSSSREKMHKKVLEKGKPDDVMPGKKGVRERLPPAPLAGMLNKRGGKVRLTFKLEQDQLWIGTKERTEKLSMSSIKAVVSEPIEGHEEYHIVALQLGPTEASRYWIYWVPAQYVDDIKDSVLGKWQMF